MLVLCELLLEWTRSELTNSMGHIGILDPKGNEWASLQAESKT